MSDVNILAAASRLNDLYQNQDRAFSRSMQARRDEEMAGDNIRATYDALTWLCPRTPEESFIAVVVIGAKIFGTHVDEVDDEVLTIMQRMLRNLIEGMRKQLTPEQFCSLPQWVKDDPQIAMRVRLIEDQDAADEAA